MLAPLATHAYDSFNVDFDRVIARTAASLFLRARLCFALEGACQVESFQRPEIKATTSQTLENQGSIPPVIPLYVECNPSNPGFSILVSYNTT